MARFFFEPVITV